MWRLRIFAGLPVYHLLGNIISVTVSLVYNDLQPEYEQLDSFQTIPEVWKKIQLEHRPPQPPLNKKMYA